MFNPFGQYGEDPGPQPGETIHLARPRGPSSRLNQRQFHQPEPDEPQLTPAQKVVDRVTTAAQTTKAFAHGGLLMAARYTMGLKPMSHSAYPLYRAGALRNLVLHPEHSDYRPQWPVTQAVQHSDPGEAQQAPLSAPQQPQATQPDPDGD